MNDAPAQLDKKVIACNYAVATSSCSLGALCYVAWSNYGGVDKVKVIARSRGGRWIEKWETLKHLTNFRAKTIPPQSPRYSDERICDGDPTEFLARVAIVKASDV